MILKTKNPPSGVGSKHNIKQSDDILQRRARLTNSLKELFLADQVPASWVAEIVRMEGLSYV